MAGLSSRGLEIKRLNEVLATMRSDAQPIFQDLVAPDDIIDTSDSSTLGRLTALYSVPIADLWEAAQEVYLGFDPNSATGVALDNLVMYGGLTRNPASASQATVVVWGAEGTFISAGQTTRALDNTLYDVISSVSLDRSSCNGFQASIPTVVLGRVYSVSIATGSTVVNASVTAIAGSTADSLCIAMANQLNANTTLLAQPSNGALLVTANDVYATWNVNVANMTITQIRSRTEVQNQQVGAKFQEANTINAIATPLLGWTSVNNPSPAVIGEDAESDSELRLRFRDSKFLRAGNLSDSLYSTLIDLDGVQYVGVFENDTDVYNAEYDLQPHSFKAVVQGGVPTQIARVIWNNKPLGIGAEGNTSATITDSQGFSRVILFDRPTPVRAYIRLELKVDPNVFPSDGEDRIKAELITYFSNNFKIGSDVIYTRLFTPINTVPGHEVTSLTIGSNPAALVSANMVVPYNGIATLDSNDIQIIIT